MSSAKQRDEWPRFGDTVIIFLVAMVLVRVAVAYGLHGLDTAFAESFLALISAGAGFLAAARWARP